MKDESLLTVPTALLAQEAKREGSLNQLIYLEQVVDDDRKEEEATGKEDGL